MSFTPTTETEATALTPPATAASAREPAEVEYPEGQWAAQSVVWHGDAVRQAATALQHHFRECEDVLVGMDLVVYYRRGDNKLSLQVVFRVGRGNRSTFRVW